VLRELLDTDGAPDDELKADLAEWISEGGKPTLDAFMKLSQDEKEGIVEYLEEFSAYEVVDAGGKTHILVHAGLADFSADRDLYDYTIDQLIFEGADYGKKYFEDKILVTGHTPTFEIDGGEAGKIFTGNNHIAVNCGLREGEKLGCICLDNGKEFYID
ncbi:MAG: serine/threonine protein phosphatase, partial [Clostridia bacterium]|nr:serine/threonine protein phosphatase [Clostridia bacterium]